MSIFSKLIHRFNAIPLKKKKKEQKKTEQKFCRSRQVYFKMYIERQRN